MKMVPLIYFFLCLLGILISGSGLGADTCARNWLQIQSNCYGYHDAKKMWSEAKIECQSYGRGTHLASILTRAQTLLISEYISKLQKEGVDVWIGLRDIHKDREWIWMDGSAYNYKSWMLGEPNNLGNSEYCVELHRSTNFRQWNDSPCNKQNAYICKHKV